MINIAEILKGVPKGTKLYCTMVGDVLFESINESDNIKVRTDRNHFVSHHIFSKYGQYDGDGECLLFPSKKQRDWNNHTFKKKYVFKPFDKVIVRDDKDSLWKANFFSHINNQLFTCIGGGTWNYCLPYNEKTAKLVGTINDYKED